MTSYRRPCLHEELTASARRARNRFAEHLAAFYWKPMFWHRACYVGSVGSASLETVRASVESQGTKPLKRNPA
ncbi:transposase [Thiorhodospira sibirica]|uniref:transposase n=1 Tax=Thiorhodospira sibirica TaxID=154347 RepID=UPI0009FC1BC6